MQKGIRTMSDNADRLENQMETKIYTVTAHKWGERHGHSYLVGVYTDEGLAEKTAKEERLRRGGKYECEILRWEPVQSNPAEMHPRYVKEL